MAKRQRRGARKRTPATTEITASSLLPRWESAPGYEAVGRALLTMTSMPALGACADGLDLVSGADVAAFQALVALAQARPVYVGPEQLAVLPPFSDRGDAASAAAALRYAAELRLPFDPLFLDFTSPGGEPCWIGEERLSFGLFGALLFRGQQPQPGALIDGGELAIFPFGAVSQGTDGLAVPAAQPRIPMPAETALGVLGVGAKRPSGGELWLGESGFADHMGSRPEQRMRAIGASLAAELAFKPASGQLPERFATPARVHTGTGGSVLPLTGAFGQALWGRRGFDELGAHAQEPVACLRAEAGVVLTLSLIALRAVYLLESANVELQQATVTRQVRRAAERSPDRTRIALTIKIRTRKRPARPTPPSGRSRKFAYAFERGGHYRHVTRGPHATEQHLKPCPKDDAAHRASGGRCRREWIPGHIVGAAEGRPLVLKTRVLDTEHS